MKVEIHIVADSQDEAAGIFRALAGLLAEPNKALQLAARGFDIIEKLANAEAPLEVVEKLDANVAEVVETSKATPARTRRSTAEIKAAKEAEEAAKLKPEEDASTDAADAEEVDAEEVHTPESLRAIAGELLAKGDEYKPKLKAILESFDSKSITLLDPKHYAAFAAELRKL